MIVLLLIAVVLTVLGYKNEAQQIKDLPSNLSNIESQVEEIKNNVTNQVVDESVNLAEESQNVFSDLGHDLAEDVKDPEVKKSIIESMNWAGFAFGLLILVSVLTAFGILPK